MPPPAEPPPSLAAERDPALGGACALPCAGGDAAFSAASGVSVSAGGVAGVAWGGADDRPSALAGTESLCEPKRPSRDDSFSSSVVTSRESCSSAAAATV